MRSIINLEYFNHFGGLFSSGFFSLSVLLAFVVPYCAFYSLQCNKRFVLKELKVFWQFQFALSLALGIWLSQMTAFLSLPTASRTIYNPGNIVFTLAVLVLTTGSISWLLSQKFHYKFKLLLSGLALGGYLGISQYSQIVDLQSNFQLTHYPLACFIVIVEVMVFCTTISLDYFYRKGFRKKSQQIFESSKAFSSLLIGIPVTSMQVFLHNSVDHSFLSQVGLVTSQLDEIFLLSFVLIVICLWLLSLVFFPYVLNLRLQNRALKEKEELLHISEIAFQRNEAIMVTDQNMNIVRVNEAFTRVTGFDESEVIGKNPRILKSGEHDLFFYKKFWNSIKDSGKWSGEVWNRRKNGEVYPEWQTVSTATDDYGEITHYISTFFDITELKLAEKEVEKLAFYDPLTGLANRRLLYERLDHELHTAKRYQRSGVLFYLDLDKFKHINDTLGHSIGDQILIETANRLQSLIRDTDTVVRLGGDEFVIVTSAQDGIHTDLTEQSTVIADKILQAMLEPYHVEKHQLKLSTSIGITIFTGINETVDSLLNRADTAMYQAKEAGRNTYRFFQKSMQEATDEKIQLEQNLRVAKDKDEFKLLYLPQFNQDKEVVGIQAVLEWDNFESGVIPASEFIPVAEETGLIIEIGHWMLDQLFEQYGIWKKNGLKLPPISVQISAKQFFQNDFVNFLLYLLDENQLDANDFVLEIPEQVFLEHLEETKDTMHALKGSGFKFSMAGFGKGYSSLTYLKQLPFDRLKFDVEFVKGIIYQPSDVSLAKAIIMFAKELDLQVLADGIETEEHYNLLMNQSCPLYQGCYLSNPLSNQDLLKLIKTAH